MDKTPESFPDWSLMRAFLAVAETGSLSAAARQLGQSQPTLGRQIRQAEAALEADLFLRRPRGLELTETGAKLVAPARRMRDAMSEISLQAAGTAARPAGPVRITASEVMAHFALPPIIAALRKSDPDITVTLLPTDTGENLLYREADIAVRMYPSTQLDLVTKRLGDIPLGIYAAQSYLDRKGTPQTPEDMLHHELIGYDKDPRILDGMRAMGFAPEPGLFATRCDDQVTYWELVKAGCGIGFAQVEQGRQTPGIVRLLPELPIPPLTVWLATPEPLRHSPRITRVWQALEEGLGAHVS